MTDHVEIHANAPDWFRRALAVPFEQGEVDVEGATVRFLAWGEPGRRGLVFVHGGGAHAHWWTHVAAKFADARQLAEALVKLYRDNATTLTPDSLHSAFYDSHPPALVRISRLQQLAART